MRMVDRTLKIMAEGGIYDQLGGGFHRYSTDRKWHIPHFEKMLYDQAGLSRAYLEAYQVTQNNFYARIAQETLDYVLRDMTDPKGGLYSAEDADSLPPEKSLLNSPDSSQTQHKKEGAFYVWGEDEINNLLGKDAEIFNYAYGVETNGNAQEDPHGEFAGKNILFLDHEDNVTALKFHLEQKDASAILKKARAKLAAARNQRPRPYRDDKILTDWNGLMIGSLAFGARVLDNPRYSEAAERSAQFVLKNLIRQDGRLLHRYRDGESAILGTLDDYAFFVNGLLDIYETTFKVEYLKAAITLTEAMTDLFEDKDKGGFFFTAQDAEALLFREKEVYDGALPAGNSIAALNLLRLGRMTMRQDWTQTAEKIFQAFGEAIAHNPMAYTQALSAFDFYSGPLKEVVIAGDLKEQTTRQMLQELSRRFLPKIVVIHRPAQEKEAQDIIRLIPFLAKQPTLAGKPTAYVCENYQCKAPTTELSKFTELIR